MVESVDLSVKANSCFLKEQGNRRLLQQKQRFRWAKLPKPPKRLPESLIVTEPLIVMLVEEKPIF